MPIALRLEFQPQDHWSSSPASAQKLLAVAEGYFKCAAALEKAKSVGRPVLWFLLSESLELRRAAKERYGSKYLTGPTSFCNQTKRLFMHF
jgi:hypothetical protein